MLAMLGALLANELKPKASRANVNQFRSTWGEEIFDLRFLMERG
jgi:hypothetical protein